MTQSVTRSREDRARGIRVARAARQLKQEDVAYLAKLNQATVAKAELGRASEQTYDQIEAVLGLAS